MSAIVPVRVLLAEVLNAAEASGVDRKVLTEILDHRGFLAMTGSPEPVPQPRYSLAHAAKDLQLAIEALRGGDGVDLTVVAAALDRLREAKHAGLGDRDLSAIYAYDMARDRSSGSAPRIEKRNPASVPPPIGAYSHAVRTGNLLFVSGQVALDENRQVVGAGDIEAQTEFVFDCLERILADYGATFDDVVSLRTYLLDMESTLPGYRAVRTRRITGDPPSSTTVEVTRLVHPALLVEVDLVTALR
jgi:3-hydroxyisobutyrate dehydrogenase